MTKVVFSPAARSDLHRIDDYTIDRFGLQQAEKALARIGEVLQSLATFPNSGMERPELDPPGRQFRYFVVLKCLIIVYEALENRIRVARILDGWSEDLRHLLALDPGEG